VANPMKWEFPAESIAANDYLIIWCDQDTMDTGLHTNFKLTSAGETVILSNASGIAINEVTMPEIESSSTYGRYVNGTGGCIRMVPTYDAANSYSAIGIDESEAMIEFGIYPNPASDLIHFVTNYDVPVQFNIIDFNGRVVFSGSAENNSEIDVSGLNRGIYFVQVPELIGVSKLVKN